MDERAVQQEQPSRALSRKALAGLLASAVILHLVTALFRIASSYKALELGYSPLWIGVMAGAYSFGPLLLTAMVGKLVDSRGERVASLLGGLLLSAASVAVVASPFNLLAAGVIFGAGNFLATVAQQALIGRLASKRERDSTFGYYGVAIAAGQMLGPLLFGIVGVLGRFDPDRMFYLCVLAALVLVITAVTLPRHVPLPMTTRGQGKFRVLLRLRGIKPLLFASMILLSAQDLMLVYLPVLGSQRGYGPELVALLLFLRAGSSILARFLFGMLLRLSDQQYLLASLATLAGFSTVLILFDMPLLIVCMAVSLAGFAVGVSLTLTMVSTADLCLPGHHGALAALRMSGNRGSQALMPIAAGMLATALGPGSIFGVMGVIILALAVLVAPARKGD